jgi:hypothetical protein
MQFSSVFPYKNCQKLNISTIYIVTELIVLISPLIPTRVNPHTYMVNLWMIVHKKKSFAGYGYFPLAKNDRNFLVPIQSVGDVKNDSVQLVNKTPRTMVHDTCNYSIHGVYQPIYTMWGPRSIAKLVYNYNNEGLWYL